MDALYKELIDEWERAEQRTAKATKGTKQGHQAALNRRCLDALKYEVATRRTH